MLCVVIGFTLHKTALLLIPLYFIFKPGKDFLRNIPLQLTLLFGALFLSGVSIWNQYLNNIDVFEYVSKDSNLGGNTEFFVP